MSSGRSEKGLLSLRYGEDEGDPAVAAVPIDIIDEDFQEVPWAPRVLELGKPVVILVRPGSYLIRAFLPSGEVVSRQARVGPLNETVVSIGPRKPPPRESLRWAYVLKKTFGFERAAESPEPVPVIGSAGIRMVRWSHNARPGESWQRVGAVELDRNVALGDPNALAEASIAVVDGRSWLEVRGPSIPARFVALPPSLSGKTRVLIVADDRSEPAFDPVDVMVSLGDGRAEAILAYLALGALEPARRLGEPLIEQIGDRLERGETPPVVAAVAGYYLLKASASDQPHDWTASLASDFPWLADGPIIRAWRLLRRPDPNPSEFRLLLVEAAGRGLPLFTLGLRLLHDGLSLAARSWPGDATARRALEAVRPYAAAANWSALMTTFYGDDPRRPALPVQWSEAGTDDRRRRGPGPAAVSGEAPDELEHVQRCLDRVVSPVYREIIRSIFRDGATPEEAANDLGIVHNPEMFYMEAMLALREQLMNVP